METKDKKAKKEPKNKNLGRAKKAKNDEFYTQFEDINEELRHYTDHFKDKVIYCNCDDPFESNFFKYFAINFKEFGLKELICTCYSGSPIANTQLSLFPDEPKEERTTKKAHKIRLKPEHLSDVEVTDMSVVEKVLARTYFYSKDGVFMGNSDYMQPTGKVIRKRVLSKLRGRKDEEYLPGDFRSKSCVELLKEADIVVTNPPFSLFREYVAQLIAYDKKFIILGNPNAITYKEFFPLLKDNKVWIGNKSMGTDMLFNVKDSLADELVKTKKEGSGYKLVNGKVKARASVIWYTNLDIPKRYEDLETVEKYYGNEDKYPKYDNYDAINVNRVADIPLDYEGVMGVPITFFDHYNPNQFYIIDLGRNYPMSKKFVEDYYKSGGKGSYKEGNPLLGYYNKGKAIIPYMRVLIKRK